MGWLLTVLVGCELNSENPKKIRDLTSQYISKLVVIPGIVTAAGKTKAKAQKLFIQCKSCSAMTSIDVKPGLTGVSLPRKCLAPQQEGAQDCGLDPYVIVPEKSTYVDQQVQCLFASPFSNSFFFSSSVQKKEGNSCMRFSFGVMMNLIQIDRKSLINE